MAGAQQELRRLTQDVHHQQSLARILHFILDRLDEIERQLIAMPTRIEYDTALDALASAIAAAIARVDGGVALTDADIATLKQDTVKVNTIGGGVAATGGFLRFEPASAVGGAVVTCTIVLPVPVGVGGEGFSCSADTPEVSFPTSVAVGPGATFADFRIDTVPVSAPKVVTFTAKSSFRTLTGTFSVNP